MFRDFLRWLRVLDEEKKVEEATQVVKEDVVVESPVEAIAEPVAEVAQEEVEQCDFDEVREDAVGEGESKFNEVCEELGIPEAVKAEGEELPVLVPVTDGGKGKGTMVNVSRDTHGKLLLEKAKSNFKSFDAVIRNAFGW